jgi:hypothetical protein
MPTKYTMVLVSIASIFVQFNKIVIYHSVARPTKLITKYNIAMLKYIRYDKPSIIPIPTNVFFMFIMVYHNRVWL